MSLPQNIITVTTVLPRRVNRPHGITVKFSPSRGNYRGYRDIAAFPINVSSYTTVYTVTCQLKWRQGLT